MKNNLKKLLIFSLVFLIFVFQFGTIATNSTTVVKAETIEEVEIQEEETQEEETQEEETQEEETQEEETQEEETQEETQEVTQEVTQEEETQEEETQEETQEDQGDINNFSDSLNLMSFDMSLMSLNQGEIVKEIAVPNPTEYTVVVGTAFDKIGLQSTIKVTYILEDGVTEDPRDEAIIWDSLDPTNIYNPDKDGDYILKATFTDASLVNENEKIKKVTVTVKGQAIADDIKALPSVADAANLTQKEKLALRSKLIDISNALDLYSTDEKAAFETYVTPTEMGKYNELYNIYLENTGCKIANFLDGDWAYISAFSVKAVHDGTGPFDTSNDPNDVSYKDRKGNDSGPNNGIVRTFDTVTYDLSYSTAVSGEYSGVKEGYMYYEFVLPYPVDKAEWEFSAMPWMGLKENSLNELHAKKDKENHYYTETKLVDGVMSQVITGKKFLAPVDPNPSAFPGEGTLNAIYRVLNVEDGTTLQPKFKLWLDHNHLDGTCPKHNIEEPKTLIGDPVTVTSELRMNVQLRNVDEIYANGVDTFNFSTGNDLAMNKTAGNVYGKINGYGVTLQAYNLDPNDGLKGVAFPSGEITLDLEFGVKYKKDDGSIIEDLPSEYTPLVWSYEAHSSATDQLDGRSIDTYVPLRYVVNTAPGNNGRGSHPMGTYSPTTGNVTFWYGGTWTGSQTGNKVSFTINNYEINPNWFPNTNLGQSTSEKTYFNPENGVRSTNIGAITAGEVFVIIPFGEGNKYLPTRYGQSGTIELTIKDSNLRASTSKGDSLPIVSDNSNQTKPNKVGLPLEDDTLAVAVYLSTPGIYENYIRYVKDINSYAGIDGTLDNITNGKDLATRYQEFAISWGGYYDAKGEKDNTVYGLNALMKFDPTALEIIGEPIHYDWYKDHDTVVSYLYATKSDGSAWTSDTEMDAAVEEDLVYYKNRNDVSAGHLIVGILAEARHDDPKIDYTRIIFNVPVRVKADAPTDKVYQIVEKVKVWKKAQYDANGGPIPRRYDVKESIVYPATHPNLNNYRAGQYEKSVYQGGIYISGHTGSDNYGDSVYITPYTTAILKSIAQIAESVEKKNFDLNTNQRVVDFVLSPSVKTLVPGSFELYTDLYIEDVLPKGLSYIVGSAYYGGTYTQNPLPGRQGKVTGGTQLEPDAITNQTTGETTLKWTISKHKVNDPVPNIVFSAYIGEPGSPNDVVNGQHLLNKVSISATEDNRPKTKVNGNYAEAGITVSKLVSTSIEKTAINKDVETGYDPYIASTINKPTMNANNNSYKVNLTTNHKTEKIDIIVIKEWKDISNPLKPKPISIKIRLYADGVEVDSKDVTAADSWSWKFKNLDKYKLGEVGKLIVYTITEDAIDGYEDPQIEWNSVVGLFKVTNCPKPKSTSTTTPRSQSNYIVPKIDYDSKTEKWITLIVVAIVGFIFIFKFKNKR